ncbi:MAG TPA: hypothetical protein PLA83_05665, partial [Deltaproteobacteria bacterium]|nr:hypothetical protein [Deltaproteobacteria bacterium]
MNIDLRRHRYTGISFILHLAVLLGFIAYAGLCPKGAPDANVFYIDIVDGSLFPNGTFANGTGAGGEAQQGAECEKPVSFSEVEKEQPPNDINPDLPLSETEPPDDPGENYGPEDKQVLASSQNQTSGGHPGGMNFGLGSGYSSYILDLWRSRATSTSRNNPWSNQSSYLVVLWRTQLMSMVQKTWKEYSNKTFANNNLRATYRLLISG